MLPYKAKIAQAQKDLLPTLPNLKGNAEWHCWACGDESRDLERAHIEPASAGGSDADPTNFFLLCPRCHREQPDAAPREYQVRWLRERESFEAWCNRELREDMEAVERASEALGQRVYAVVWLLDVGQAGIARILNSIPVAGGYDTNLRANRRAALVQSFENFVRARL